MAVTYILLDGKVKSIKEDRDPKEVIAKLIAKGHSCEKIGKPPSVKTMSKWMDDGIAKATDGCKVEPDGTCPHGHKSWMIQLGII